MYFLRGGGHMYFFFNIDIFLNFDNFVNNDIFPQQWYFLKLIFSSSCEKLTFLSIDFYIFINVDI